MRAIGVLGGTFDPIHFGHLRMAQELAEAVHLDEVLFVPAAIPPHRQQPATSAQHRAAMVAIAIQDNPRFRLDMRELLREGASYTIDTLQSLRMELGEDTSITLLLGSDAFLGLPGWHHWQELLDLAHLVVAHRPSAPLVQEKMHPQLQTLYKERLTEDAQVLAQMRAGHLFMQHITPLDISATHIRGCFRNAESPRYLLPDSVIDYILKETLYS
ncbi:MAG TPA: nicotinate-nucleotide adenylyltransferase [Methylophilaceae bacterium]|nr:nicotinate-nucleotide adenylyltransferase [Methylophilaceae bacterium]